MPLPHWHIKARVHSLQNVAYQPEGGDVHVRTSHPLKHNLKCVFVLKRFLHCSYTFWYSLRDFPSSELKDRVWMLHWCLVCLFRVHMFVFSAVCVVTEGAWFHSGLVLCNGLAFNNSLNFKELYSMTLPYF